jgi:hypothetical protein
MTSFLEGSYIDFFCEVKREGLEDCCDAVSAAELCVT